MKTSFQSVSSPAGGDSPAVTASAEAEASRDNDQALTFDLGLVMAGAVSAGSYTAGVIDFLLEALDAWEEAKENEKHLPPENRTVPYHQVRIKVIAGASAGGMTAAMMAASFRNRCCGIARKSSGSLMKDCWVDKIDIDYLLNSDDMRENKGSIRSLLDSTRVAQIADEAFAFEPAQREWQPLAYVDEKLKLYLTLSNLRGLPYEFNIAGETGFKYGMMKFTDYEEATINRDTTAQEWLRVKDAALATGAFPVGLSARLIHRDPKEYRRRSKEDNLDFISVKFDDQATYSFACVDGGVFNNEPLELARRALYACSAQAQTEAKVRENIIRDCSKPASQPAEDSAGSEHQRYVSTLRQSLILIDPFPNAAAVDNGNDEEDSLKITNVIVRLITALRRQAVFKPEELLVAAHRRIYSSFMIAPVRYTTRGLKADYPIASGFLEGFGGFFLKKFRQHDYELGR